MQADPGVEVKIGRAGFLVAPPSVHPVTGRRYTWTRPPATTPLASAPAWLLELARVPEAPAPLAMPSGKVLGDVAERARRYVAEMPPAVSGQGGHDATFRVALALVRGFILDFRDALRILAEDYNPKCVPPWSRRELQRKVHEASRATRVPLGYLLDSDRRAA